MSKVVTLRRAVSLVAFALWLPFVFDIYPAPWQREAEIKAMAREALTSQKSLAAMGVDTTDIVHAQTEQQWTEGLTESYWRMWIENLALLIFGAAAAWLTWLGRRWWIVLILATSLWVIWANLPSMLSHIVESGSLGRWLELWSTVIGRQKAAHELTASSLFVFYHLLVWPLLHLALVIVATGAYFVDRHARRNVMQPPV